MKRRFISILMAAVLILGCFTTFSFAATTTKTMTSYREVIKSGKYAYCAAGSWVYRVNLETKSKKRLAKTSGYVTDMKLYKGYVYFNISYPASTRLYRVKKSGGGLKKLGTDIDRFAISGSRIYYRIYVENYDYENDIDHSYYTVRSMKLNGTDKRSAKSYKVKQISKTNNVKGYRIKSVEKADGKYAFYLKKPSGKTIYLCKHGFSFG